MRAGADFKIDVGFGDAEVLKKTFGHLLIIVLASVDDTMKDRSAFRRIGCVVFCNGAGNGSQFHEIWPGSGDGHQLHLCSLLMGLFGVCGKGRERKIRKKSLQASGGFAEVVVMAKTGKWFCMLHARLLRVDFPGVQVENEWLAFLAIDGLQGITAEPIGKQAKITAAGDGYFHAQKKGRGNGVFAQTVGVAVGEAGRVGNTVGVVVDGKNGGIVGEAEFLENIERPKGLGGDGVTGGTVAENGFANDVFQDGFDLGGVCAEFLRRHVVHLPVPIAVTADGVALIVDGLHQLGKPVGDPTDNEERGLGVVLGQQVQDFFGVAHYPLFHAVPVLGIDDVLEGGYLEVVFHVDGEVVADGLHEGIVCYSPGEVKQRNVVVGLPWMDCC